MSIGDSGIGTVGPTGEVKGVMVTGVNVSDHVGGTVKGAEGGTTGEAEGGTVGGAEGGTTGEAGVDRESGGGGGGEKSGESTGSVGEAVG